MDSKLAIVTLSMLTGCELLYDILDGDTPGSDTAVHDTAVPDTGVGGVGLASVYDATVYYSFDQCSSTTPELMGTGLDAQLVDATCGGSALHCGGYADASDDSLFEPEQFTLSAWVFSDDYSGGDERTIVSKANTDDYPNGYWLIVSDGKLRLTISACTPANCPGDGAGAETAFYGASSLTRNTWHHVAATFDGDTAVLYLDGVEDGSETVSHGILYGPESFLIGAMTNRGYDFFGYIDEVALWDVAFSAGEVEALHNSYAVP